MVKGEKNNGKISKEEISEQIEKLFGINTKNCYAKFTVWKDGKRYFGLLPFEFKEDFYLYNFNGEIYRYSKATEEAIDKLEKDLEMKDRLLVPVEDFVLLYSPIAGYTKEGLQAVVVKVTAFEDPALIGKSEEDFERLKVSPPDLMADYKSKYFDPHDEDNDEQFTKMTLRQYACIHLKVAQSGIEWLDDLIKTSQDVHNL